MNYFCGVVHRYVRINEFGQGKYFICTTEVRTESLCDGIFDTSIYIDHIGIHTYNSMHELLQIYQ
jgi:hypothetical protein